MMTSRIATIGLGIVALVGGALVVVLLSQRPAAEQPTLSASLPPATAEVRRGSLAETRSVTGTLGFGDLVEALPGTDKGIVTYLAPEGDVVERGEALFAVDGWPVIVLYGDTPQYRTLRFDGPAFEDAVWVELETAQTDVREAELKLVLERERLAAAEAELADLEARLSDAGRDEPVTTEFAKLLGEIRAAEARLSSIRELHARQVAASVELATAENDLATARANFDAAIGTVQQEVRATKVDVASASVAVATAERALTEARQRLGDLEGTHNSNRDATQLGENLAALGYEGNAAEAVRAWQTDAGLPATGIVTPQQVLVVAGPLRIADHVAAVGEMISDGQGDQRAILTYTATEKVVTVALSVSDQGLAVEGRNAVVTLPTDTEVQGVISDVGATVTEGEIEVTVAIPDQSVLAGFDAASVDVEFISDERADVLSVPVAALLALPEGGFAVEVVEGASSRIVPVKTGMFGSGRVEISGEGIGEGAEVGVPR